MNSLVPDAAEPVPDPGGAPAPLHAPIARWRAWLRRLYITLRIEHRSPGKVAAAVAVGVFVGCSPWWGFHFLLSMLAASVLRLNRFIVYAAANLSNPVTAAPLLFAEVQVGHRLLRGTWLALGGAPVDPFRLADLATDLILGSVVVGAGLGVACGIASWLVARAGSHHARYRDLVDRVVVAYVDVSIRDAEAARARLLRDPVFPILVEDRAFDEGRRVLDLGCGRGLVGALIGILVDRPEARSYLGVDLCDRYVRTARRVLEAFPGCAVETTDLRDFDPPPADLVIVNDVLRFLPFGAQDALLRRLARVLPPGARMVLREKDAGGGWRFRFAALGDALEALVPGRPRHGSHYRRKDDLRNALVAAGFSVSDRAVARSVSAAWDLLEAVRRPVAAAKA